jgi:hypothetical protein
MFRTTSALFPIRDDLFVYIGRERDSLLRVFQEQIKSSISAAVQTAFKLTCDAPC